LKKILITGGAGFIGSLLANDLLAQSCFVRILDPLSTLIHGSLPAGLGWLQAADVEFVRGSILDRELLTKSLEGVTTIVHLAAETGTGQSMYDIASYNRVNSQGTALLLDVLANTPNHTVSRIILASSRSIYGEGAYICPSCDTPYTRQFPASRSFAQLAAHQWDPQCVHCCRPLRSVPTRECDQALPASIYAATKYAQEHLIRIASQSLNIDYAILRFQNVYGERQSLNNPYTGILSIFSTRIRRGLDLPIFEDGLESRDFVHVSDVSRAVIACILSSEPISDVLNVGSGLPTSIFSVAEQLMGALGRKVPLRVTAEYRLGDIRHNYADISRIKKLLPEFPFVSLSEGLTRFAAWVHEQPLPEDGLDRANAELRARKLMS
jgi:dTDP-L-rhamnose 4-epimerase